jgi:sugar O-acyltransferase (sialic acid O-acetyltransferase NeuD family)
MNDLVIIGAGAFGRQMVRRIRYVVDKGIAQWNLLGFIDEDQTGEVEGVKVLGKLADFLKMDTAIQFFVADLDGNVREKIARTCKAAGFTGATIWDEIGNVAPNCEIGEGCYLGYKCCLSPGVKLGDFCVVERGSIIGHDTVIGDYSTLFILASLGGDSVIGSHNFFGIKNVVINMVNTPDHCSFAAGSCVIKNTNVPGYYAGVPAKLVRPYQD